MRQRSVLPISVTSMRSNQPSHGTEHWKVGTVRALKPESTSRPDLHHGFNHSIGFNAWIMSRIELQFVKTLVRFAARHQFLVRALLDDAAFVQHDDAVGVSAPWTADAR